MEVWNKMVAYICSDCGSLLWREVSEDWVDYCLNKEGKVEFYDKSERDFPSDECISRRKCVECDGENLFRFDEKRLSKKEIKKILKLSEDAIDLNDEKALKEIQKWVKRNEILQNLK